MHLCLSDEKEKQRMEDHTLETGAGFSEEKSKMH